MGLIASSTAVGGHTYYLSFRGWRELKSAEQEIYFSGRAPQAPKKGKSGREHQE